MKPSNDSFLQQFRKDGNGEHGHNTHGYTFVPGTPVGEGVEVPTINVPTEKMTTAMNVVKKIRQLSIEGE